MAAESLCRDKSYLGQFYPPMKMHMKMQLNGGPEAITVAAHKLARIIYAMVTQETEYDESRFAEIEKRNRGQARKRLTKQALKIGFTLQPIQTPVQSVS